VFYPIECVICENNYEDDIHVGMLKFLASLARNEFMGLRMTEHFLRII